jgi:hypothetical protein
VPRLRRLAHPLAAAFIVALLPGPARADVEDEESSYDPGPQERRSDFAVSLSLGAATGAVSGYPNELEKLGLPEHEADTGFGVGPAGGFWVGGALRDWLVFGVGYTQHRVSGGGLESTGELFLAHVEAYPLFARGGIFHDLGLFGEFGAGGRTILKDGEQVADGGILSVAGVGVVYEPLRLGSHFSAGPTLLVSHQWSESLTATLAVASFRIAYYGGPG